MSPVARRLNDLPSPAALPMIGHLHLIRPLQVHRQMEAWAQRLGAPYLLRLATDRVVVFDDVDLFRQVLADRPGRFSRGGRIRPVAREMGFDGVFSAEGADWRRQRGPTAEALAPAAVRSFHPDLVAITRRLHRRWCAAASEGRPVAMTEDLMRYTVDVTSTLAFGEDPNTLESGGDGIQAHLSAIFPMFMKRVMTPFATWRYLKMPQDRALDRHLALVHSHVAELIARGRRRAEAGSTKNTLLDGLIERSNRADSDFTAEDVAANVITMLLAGEDTTAHALAWTIYFLCARPDFQERLRAEAREAFGDQAVCDDPRRLRTLALAEAAGTEALRLKPVVPFHSFDANEDVELGGVQVPKNTKLFFLNRPAMTDPLRFAAPGRYDPDRWLRATSLEGHDPRAFLLFGAGPRVCPGRHLAMTEIRLVISMLVNSFTFELIGDPAGVEETQSFTMGPDRLPVRLRMRPDAPAPVTTPELEAKSHA